MAVAVAISAAAPGASIGETTKNRLIGWDKECIGQSGGTNKASDE